MIYRLINLRSVLFLGVCVIFLEIEAHSQKDLSQLKVVYEFRYIRDLAQKDVPYISDMILSIGRNSSTFTSQYLYSTNLENNLNTRSNPSGGAPPLAVGGGNLSQERAIGPGIGVNKYGIVEIQELYKNYSTKMFELNASLGVKLVQIRSAIPKINWNLLNEKRKIGKYSCQKATCDFGGRKYEVWFTPELPFRDGPWKLNGLPGLILEASDVNNEVIFRFKDIVKNISHAEYIFPFLHSDYSYKVNMKDYNRLTQAYLTDPEAFIQTGLPGTVKIFFVNIDGGATSKTNSYKVKKYNPIEKSLQ